MANQQEDVNQFRTYFLSRPDFSASAFEQLLEDTNDEVALRILARFHQTLAESRQRLNESLEKHDSESIWKTCHKVAGSAELLGFKLLGKNSRNLSEGLQASPEINPHLEELQSYIHACDALYQDITSSFPNRLSYL